ncbi:MAG: hypothetical protein K1X57_10090 [Gemmataceae bacterium]|nr:hypothetical protein [Gemmataceae bacterium]
MASRRWRVLIRGVVIAIVVAFVAFAASLWMTVIFGRAELQSAMAEAAADDPHWQLADREARRKVYSQQENGAEIVRRCADLIDECSRKIGPVPPANFQLFEVSDLGNDPSRELTPAQSTVLAGHMATYGPAIQEARRLRQSSGGRFNRKQTGNPFDVDLAPGEALLKAVRIVRVMVEDRISSEDIPAAMDDIFLMTSIRNLFRDEPMEGGQMAALACDNAVCFSIERLLGMCRLTEEQLVALSRTVEQVRTDAVVAECFREQRARCFAGFEYAVRNPTAAGPIPKPKPATWKGLLPLNDKNAQAIILRSHNEAIQVLNRPTWEWMREAERIEGHCPKLKSSAGDDLVLIVWPIQAELMRQARLSATHAALAIERYRLAHGRWPPGPEELVADGKLSAWPVDPFDGKPLRWKPVDFGILLYSIGPGGVDEFGKYDPSLRGGTSSNITFRLYNPDQRRRPASSP